VTAQAISHRSFVSSVSADLLERALDEQVGPGFEADVPRASGRRLVRCARGCRGTWQVCRWPLSAGLRLTLLRHLAWHIARGDSW